MCTDCHCLHQKLVAFARTHGSKATAHELACYRPGLGDRPSLYLVQASHRVMWKPPTAWSKTRSLIRDFQEPTGFWAKVTIEIRARAGPILVPKTHREGRNAFARFAPFHGLLVVVFNSECAAEKQGRVRAASGQSGEVYPVHGRVEWCGPGGARRR
jgi:hypothetical protein